MIVVDASIVGPIVLLDEAPLPSSVAAALTADRLIAPAHWPTEIANLMLVAWRRGRVDAGKWDESFAVIAALRVTPEPPPTVANARAVAMLARQEGLTAYDAAYLHLALAQSAAIATLDRALIDASRRRGIVVLTLP